MALFDCSIVLWNKASFFDRLYVHVRLSLYFLPFRSQLLHRNHIHNILASSISYELDLLPQSCATKTIKYIVAAALSRSISPPATVTHATPRAMA